MLVIGIAGETGPGKTTVIRKTIEKLPGDMNLVAIHILTKYNQQNLKNHVR